ncbi:MAG: hypothetical protein VCA74_01090 [Deltaproteobacteria bacterium]
MRRIAAIAVAVAILTVFCAGPVAAMEDRVEKRRRELILPDEYLDPSWPLPPIFEPEKPPVLEGEDDSAAEDEVDDGREVEWATDSVSEEPFEDIDNDWDIFSGGDQEQGAGEEGEQQAIQE